MSMNIDKIIELDSPRFSVRFYEDDLIIDDRLKECHVYAVRYGNFVEGRASSVEERYLDKNGRLCHSSTDDKPALFVRGSYHFFLSKNALDDPAAEIKEDHCIKLVRVNSANQNIKFDVKSEIRSEDGGEPVLVLAEDKKLKYKGLPIGLGGGSFEWEAEGFIEIDGAYNEEIVTIKPKKDALDKKKGKELKAKSRLTLKYKIDEESEAFAKAEVEITVIGGLKLNLFPRKLKWSDKPMLFEKERDDNGRVQIKEILPKFVSKTLPDEQKSNDSFTNLKEVEYNYYIDFAEKKKYASGEENYYCEKEVVFYFEYGKIVGLEESEKKEKQLWAPYSKKNIKFKLTRTDEESELRFVEKKKRKESLLKEQELIPDDKGLFRLKLAYPLQEVANEDEARKLRIKIEMVADSNTSQELTLNLTRNSHVEGELAEVIGDRNDPNGARGFLVADLPKLAWTGDEGRTPPSGIDYDTIYSTVSDGVRRFQQLLVYDLDRRDINANRNGVDGHFKGNTTKYLKEFMNVLGNDNLLRDSSIPVPQPQSQAQAQAQDQDPLEHLLRHIDIDSKDNEYAVQEYTGDNYIGLKEYLKAEYDYKYQKGEIIDRQLLIGNVNNNSAIYEIDGLLEVLEYNENNRDNLTANHMAHNCVQVGVVNNDFNSFSQGDSSNSNWYLVTGNDDVLQEVEDVEDRAPAWGSPQLNDAGTITGYSLSYRRRHRGCDYGGNAANKFLRSAGFMRIRSSIVRGADPAQMKIQIEAIGLGRTMYIIHLNPDDDVIENRLFYPDEEITGFPTIRCGTGPHFHIEKWKKRFGVLAIHPNRADDPADEGTVFYMTKYRRQLQDGENNLQRYVQVHHNAFFTQPADPY